MAKRKWSKEHKEWRAKLLDRDKGCIVCGKEGKYLNAHHLIPENFSEYEFCISNGVILCPTCHTLGKWSAHKNPIWFADWLKYNRPKLFDLAELRLKQLIYHDN